jgi:hypothetical protein
MNQTEQAALEAIDRFHKLDLSETLVVPSVLAHTKYNHQQVYW